MPAMSRALYHVLECERGKGKICCLHSCFPSHGEMGEFRINRKERKASLGNAECGLRMETDSSVFLTHKTSICV